jgi:hypothetical protein
MQRIIFHLVFLAFSGTVLHAQLPDFTGREYRKARYTVYQLGDFPVGTENRSYLAEYVLEYQVLLKKELSRTAADSLRAVLSDSSNYMTLGMVRTCPFIGRYGVKILTRQTLIEIVISQPGCIKMILRSGKEDGPRYFDLRKENAIYPFLEKSLFRLEE